MTVVWVLESEVFPHSHIELRAAVQRAGQRLIEWDDHWWSSGRWPTIEESAVVFHGSLGNAARLAAASPWRPGAFCNSAAFHCSHWYPGAQAWLLNSDWRCLPADQFVAQANRVLAEIGAEDVVFVRPDSPLKPFSGRVLASRDISLAALDFGFYFDDPELPVIVAPTRSLLREWRYVVVSGVVVAGSAYAADGRQATPDDPTGEPWHFAAGVANTLPAPEDAYVLDVCESEQGLRLLELNPFSGADLYACDSAAVVDAISQLVEGIGAG